MGRVSTFDPNKIFVTFNWQSLRSDEMYICSRGATSDEGRGSYVRNLKDSHKIDFLRAKFIVKIG